MPRVLTHYRLLILLVGYLIIVTAYNITVPLAEGDDEFGQFRYIRFIAEHQRLPQTPEERTVASYKSSHPPLYHGLTALLFQSVDSSETEFKRILYAEVPQQALIYELMDVNWIVPTAIMEYPYQGAVLLWHLSRLFSSLLSIGVLVMIYVIVLELMPGKKSYALIAVFIIAFIPRFSFSGATTTDDTMLAFWMSVYLFLMVKLIKGDERLRLFAFIGVSLGLAMLTKFTPVPIFATTAIALCFLAWRRRWGWTALIRRGFIVFGCAGILLSFWFGFVILYFNQIDELGFIPGIMKAILPRVAGELSGADLVSGSASVTSTNGDWLQLITLFPTWLARTAQTFFLATLPNWPTPAISLMLGITLIFAAIAVVSLVIYWPQASSRQKLWQGFFLMTIAAFVPIMLFRFYLNLRIDESAQGRHILLPAASAIGILLMWGWVNWTRSLGRRWLRPIFPSLLLFMNIIQLNQVYTIFPDPLPVSLNTASRPAVDVEVRQTVFDTIELVGYTLDRQPSTLELELVWQAHQRPATDYLSVVQLHDSANHVVASWVGHPAGEIYPSRVWEPDEQIINRVTLPLAYLEPGAYTLTVALAKAYTQPPEIVTGPLISEELTISAPVTETDQGQTMRFDNPPVELTYQLWPRPKFSFNLPTFKHRATIALLTHTAALPAEAQLDITLVGPDAEPIPPLMSSQTVQTFIVGADWPSGVYQMRAVITLPDGTSIEERSAPLFTVENHPRLFTPPAMDFQVDANFYDYIKLLGYNLPESQIDPGEDLPIFIYWQDLQIINANLTGFTHLYDSDNNLVATFDRQLPPFYGGTINWVPGEVIGDGFTLPLPPDLPDGIYSLTTGLFLRLDANSWVPVPLMDEQGRPSDITHVDLGQIKVGQAPPQWVSQTVSPQIATEATFADAIRLIGIDLKGQPSTDSSGEQPHLTLAPSATLELTTYWQPLVRPPADYTLFAHINNDRGETVAQTDRPPTGGAYPTSLWEPGEIIHDQAEISLTDLSPGTYTLVIGLYDRSGARLPVDNATADSLTVQTFEIVPN